MKPSLPQVVYVGLVLVLAFGSEIMTRQEVIQAKGAVIESCTDLLTALINYREDLHQEHKQTITEFIHYLNSELHIY